MAYDLDFRNRVLEYVTAGHSKKATCALFGISTNTLYVWEKQLSEQGHLERKNVLLSLAKFP
ncbi:helix-turn-helix domain-containing protein [Streptococcus sp. O1]|uniref:helix-turn-helix domain-containing protein n=1 Tax=Streptococcus sp. O1 TaxID=2928735 RepID=UPI00358E22F2